jgi:NAD+-dependent secondary alcohol dehydrogenase Adh1
MAPTENIVFDPKEEGLALAAELAPTTRSTSRASATSRPCELTDGHGADAIIDFVGENGAIEDGVAMIRDGGFYYVIGYLRNIHAPSSRKYSKANSGRLAGTTLASTPDCDRVHSSVAHARALDNSTPI